METALELEHVKYGGNLFEGSLVGSDELHAVDMPYGKLSAIICWDADFPNIIKQAVAQNVDLLFIPRRIGSACGTSTQTWQPSVPWKTA